MREDMETGKVVSMVTATDVGGSVQRTEQRASGFYTHGTIVGYFRCKLGNCGVVCGHFCLLYSHLRVAFHKFYHKLCIIIRKVCGLASYTT